MPTAEQKREYQKRYREKYPERVRETKRRSREKHQEKRNAERRAWRAKNREHLNEYKKRWLAANPDRVSLGAIRKRLRDQAVAMGAGLRLNYSITIDDYNAVLRAQGGVCAICRTARVTVKSKRLFVDHCHFTGQIRGLLCNHCNMGLGFFMDKPELMRRAITYIQEFQASQHPNWLDNVNAVIPKLPEIAHGDTTENGGGGGRLTELGRPEDYAPDGIFNRLGNLSAQACEEGCGEGLAESKPESLPVNHVGNRAGEENRAVA